jgi:very-short-patch-repair endonuclease
LAQQWEAAGTRLVGALRRSWLSGWLDQAHRERAELVQFDQVNHEEVVARFRRAEVLTFAYNRARVALHHWRGLPGGGGGVGQLGILRRQTELKTRHWPIRQLLAHAPQAVQAVKPVFMMSPMSVAAFLAPEGPRFDLVIFDEASQVRPVDAFGALMRGAQAVVVGDSKQMPPSSFFDRVLVSDSVDDDELPQQLTADVESVLGLMKARGVPERTLRWHYRSRHPSLIAVSNHEFYENRLIVSPSPDHGETPDGAGLSLRHLPMTSYDRGGTRTNVGEAQAVAEAVMAHAQGRASRTLGVVAFSVAQKRAIEDALAKLRKANPAAERFFDAHPNEPFFCKNLENVQGDERDVIFISIGYGKTADGNLAMQFGPLSGPGGERRLNVLISRARYRCEVFTNIVAEDIAVERTQSIGVRSLKNFLQFAQSRRLEHMDAAGDHFDSPFEEEVAYALRRLGHTVHTQVGSACFRVDLAVVDPKSPSRYLLGIECDGATYHQQVWARDRDRLREEVLRGMGWSIHRIWSTNWFANPIAQLREVVAAIERAAVGPVASAIASATSSSSGTSPASVMPVASRPAASSVACVSPVNRSTGMEAAGAGIPAGQTTAALPVEVARNQQKTRSTTTLVAPYRIAQEVFATSGELRDANPASVAQVLARIVTIESPVHIEDLHRRFLAAAGAGRTGSRIQLTIDSGLGHAVTMRTIIRRGDFCWKPGEERARPRYRGLDHPGKRLDYVAHEELAEAVLLVVRESYGLHQEDVSKAAGKLLGFQGIPDDAQLTIDGLVQQLIRDGRMIRAGMQVRCA